MLSKTRKLLSALLAAIFMLSAFGSLGIFNAVSEATPRITDKLTLDTDANGGYEGDYVIAYNPSTSPYESLTTGVIYDQIAFNKSEKAVISSARSANEPFTVEFEQRATASDIKYLLSGHSSEDGSVSALNESITTMNYSVGQMREFNIYADLENEYTTAVPFMLSAKGQHCYIWTIPGESYALTDSQANSMANEYDTKIYQNMLTNFGEYLDPEESGMLNILVYDIQDGFGITTNGYTCGYFNYYDLAPEVPGNNAAMIHIDTYPTIHWNNEIIFQEAYSTIVHELQHLINFTQYIINPNSPEDSSSIMSDWLNECCSLAAEEMVYPDSTASERLLRFASSTVPYASGTSLYAWENDIMNYSMMYLFGQYIRMQTGSYNAFKKMLTVYGTDTNPSEAKAVETSVAGSALNGFSLSDIVLAFKIAMVANEVSAYNGIYGFCGNPVFDALPYMLYTSTSAPHIYGGGSIVIKPQNGVFNPTTDSASGLVYVGISTGDSSDTPAPDTTISFKSSNTALFPSKTFDLTVNLETVSVNSVSSMELIIPIDHNFFSFVSASLAPELLGDNNTNSICEYREDEYGAYIFISWNSTDGRLMPVSNGAIATITLKVSEDIVEDQITLIEVSGGSIICNGNGDPIPFLCATLDIMIVYPLMETSPYSFNYDKMYIENLPFATTADEFLGNFKNGLTVSLLNQSGIALSGTDSIGTGVLVTLLNDGGDTIAFNILIKGEITGDAALNSRDIAALQKHVLGTTTLTGAYLDAADLNSDLTCNSRDILALQKLILGAGSSTPVPASVPSTIKKMNMNKSILPMAAGTVISVTSSQAVIAPGDTFTVNVSFDSVASSNISVLELVIPINPDLFTFVDGSAESFLSKGNNTISGATFIAAKNQLFCNWVDVSSSIPSNSSAICSFQLTAKQSVTNASASLALASSSFLCDINLIEVPYSSHGADVVITNAQGLTLRPGSDYTIDSAKRYLYGVPQSADAGTVLSNFVSSGILSVVKDGSEISSQTDTGTGYEVRLTSGGTVIDRLTIIILGDLNGDASINSRDLAALQKHILETSILSGCYLAAADMNNDSSYNSRDISSLQKLILNI